MYNMHMEKYVDIRTYLPYAYYMYTHTICTHILYVHVLCTEGLTAVLVVQSAIERVFPSSNGTIVPVDDSLQYSATALSKLTW